VWFIAGFDIIDTENIVQLGDGVTFFTPLRGVSVSVLLIQLQKSQANGAYNTVNHFACNFAKCFKFFFHQQIEW